VILSAEGSHDHLRQHKQLKVLLGFRSWQEAAVARDVMLLWRRLAGPPPSIGRFAGGLGWFNCCPDKQAWNSGKADLKYRVSCCLLCLL
jgi:hypothetical protein